MCGAIGGTAVALLAFNGMAAMLNLDRNFLQATWGFKEIVTVAASLIGMLAGFALGLGVGMSIDVRSENKNHILTVLWHYVANGMILWVALLSFLLARTLGQQGTMGLFERLGLWHSSLLIAGNGAFWCMAIAGLLLMTRQQSLRSKPRFLPRFLLALPLSVAMGYTQFRLLGLSGNEWVIISCVFPLILLPLSVQMIARDLWQRQEILAESYDL